MAKKVKQRGEKLGEVLGKRRPFAGAILIFFGVIIMLAMLDYIPGQSVFFKAYLEPFFNTTDSAGANICGKFGATFCVLAYISIGAAAMMMPVYLMWLGVLLLKRRANAVNKGTLCAIVGGLLLLSIFAAVLQGGIQAAGSATPSFPAGWGGKFGTVVFDYFLNPFFDVWGTSILVASLYLFCLVVVFVDSPVEAAMELVGVIKKSPSIFLGISKIIWKIISFVPALIIGLFVARRRAKENGDDDDQISLTIGNGVRLQTTKRENAQEPTYENFAGSSHDEPENSQPTNLDNQTPAADVAEISDAATSTNQGPEIDSDLKALASDLANSDISDNKFENPITDFSSRFNDDEPIVAYVAENSEPIDDGVDAFEESLSSPAPVAGASLATSNGVGESEEDFSDLDESERANSIVSGKDALLKEDSDDDTSVSDIDGAAEISAAAESISPKVVAKAVGAVSKSAQVGDGKLKVEVYKPEDCEITEKQKKEGDYIFPSIELLTPAPVNSSAKTEDYEARMTEIVDRIGSFGIKVLPSKAMSGPVITRYEVIPAAGVRINKIASLEDDIALGIRATKVRVIAPIPGTGTVGIEVPNVHRQMVCMRDIITSKEWINSKAEIPIALGKDVTGVPIVLDLTKMPHALIAGSTGSGKSVCMNSIVASLVYKTTPKDLRFIMVDPKVVELQVYNSLPHMLVPVVTNPKKVPAALNWLISEMMHRYQVFKEVKVRNIAGFNAKILKDKEENAKAEALDSELTPEERQAAMMATEDELPLDRGSIEIPTEKMPYIVCIIDELADLMMVAGKEVEGAIARLTQLARAAGIHLLVATQRPSTDVITGLIKSNLPTRIAFRVSSQIDSRTIIDKKGAETLIGNGDMLFTMATTPDPVRAQGAFMSDDEINKIVEALKVNGEPEFADEIQAQIDSAGEDEDSGSDDDGGEYNDTMTSNAIRAIKASHKASTSFLQRKLGIGYGRAARIMDELEEKGLVGPDKGPGTQRDIYLD